MDTAKLVLKLTFLISSISSM